MSSFDQEVLGVTKWAETIANERGCSALNVILEFNKFYRRFKDIAIAKNYVESGRLK